ncbi:PhoX family protein [Ideonella paludis]|uniref:PhoX family phosphatase n=1 Tax=Ideonella paludis TaxID=1233411 RepID=A0ABS5DZN6_9BURK|nr:PhoX family phosphatase [Ideonella paludis]MBQ0936605.1 PhoX family phosphatase [Ideonella paludis]
MSHSSDFNDENSNTSDNAHFATVLDARLSRRNILRGSVGTAATALFGSISLAACGGGDDTPAPVPAPPPAADTGPMSKLGFQAVAKSTADTVTLASGYTATVVYALGDPLTADTAAFKNDGTDTDFERRAGDHHDGMEWFGLSSDGLPSSSANDRGLLAINHEATTDETRSSFFLHANGGTATLPRPASEVDKETAIHGISVVEVKRTGSTWAYVKDSAYNRRVTSLSEVEISGPARGHAQLVTKYSIDGTRTRGTLNNCGTGKTPWGSFLTGEENWFGYFTRPVGDDAARGNDKSVTALKRYGRAEGATSRHGWESAGSADIYARWLNAKTGTSADGSDDYRNEMNGMGYIVEMDPYRPSSRMVKRTALGRFAHESAAFSLPKAGEKLAVYMGDDARNEYIYKFVSDNAWSAADANPVDRIATGAKYLDSGKLFVAKFNSDGSGQWIELNLAAIPSSYTAYTFADEADIRINCRLAADAVGATKMDRPEWCATHPTSGEIYFTLTNNSNRRVAPTAGSTTQLAPDSANPRAYSDVKGTSTQQGNVNGHILRVKEGSGGGAAVAFTWDVYLFGAQSDADTGLVNLSSLTADQDFSSPDGLVFSKSTGICWIQTDDGAYTDASNCMMLAGIPGSVGDGAKKTLAHSSTLSVDTFLGKAPTADTLKRFLVGPKDCEITGLVETPDGKTLFINIQHPGEGTKMADIADPSKYTSQWPSNAGYGAGKRPRSATIVITKNDGGRIGN